MRNIVNDGASDEIGGAAAAGHVYADRPWEVPAQYANQCIREVLTRGGSTRVLMIDDSRSEFVLAREMLSDADSANISLDWVGDYESGKDAILRGTHDVYLVDYRLGTRSGLDLLATVRECGVTPTTIMLTNQDRLDVAARSIELGAMDFLVKGQFTAPLLTRSIQYAVARRWFYEKDAESRDLLRKKNKRLSELYANAHQFVDNVSHEFRTPLTVIKEFASILADGLAGELNSEQREFTGIILSRVDDLSHMVNDMLDISRLETGLLGAHRREHSVSEIIDHVRPSLERKAVSSGVDLKFAVVADLPPVFCDAENIGRVIINLVVNACKFCDPDGRVELWARHDPDEAEVVIGVTDTGPGIGQEHLTSIFERFKQVGGDIRTVTKGVGLGLNIAKELVTTNFGDIHVESELGQGSTFKFTVPTYVPIEIVRRFTDRIAGSRDEVSHLSLLRITIDPSAEPEACAKLGLFLARQTRLSDLVFRAGDHVWLVLAAADEPQLDEMIERIKKAHGSANEGMVDALLPSPHFAVAGTWHLANGSHELIEAFRNELASLGGPGHYGTT